MINMKIREAKLKDVEEISYLNSLLMKYHLRFDKYWAVKKNARKQFANYMKKMIRSPNAFVIVAEDNRKIVGYTFGKIIKHPPVLKIERAGHLNDMFVLESYRRKGTGSKMTHELFKWFKSKGLDYAELDVDFRNKVGMRAWKSLGFKENTVEMKRKI